MTDDALEMRVPRKGPASVLTPVDLRLPPPAPGEARVTIEAAGVAYADIMMRQGAYPGHAPPVTPGYDFVGRVEAVGPGVTGVAVGQRVVGVTTTGSYATRRNVKVEWLVPAPENVDAAQLVAVALNGVTAWQMLHRVANPAAGESILVHGAAGGVGTLLLDLARLAGIHAIGSASRGKADVIRARGGEPIDYQNEDVVQCAQALSHGGVVAAFDHIGGKHFKKVSMAALRPGGVGILYGGYDATRDGKVHPLAMADLLINTVFSGFKLFGKGQGVVGYSMPVWRDARPSAYQQDLTAMLTLVADGTLSPLIGATFPLREAAQAHRALETRSVTGKIVLLIE